MLAAAVLILMAALLVGVLVGPAGLTARSVLLDLLDAIPGVHVDSGLTPQQHAILWQIRLPRVVLGALVGATLAIAGAAYQGVFRNPLADPYLLGVSSGPASVRRWRSWPVAPASPRVPAAAFVGGVLAVGRDVPPGPRHRRRSAARW